MEETNQNPKHKQNQNTHKNQHQGSHQVKRTWDVARIFFLTLRLQLISKILAVSPRTET